MEHTSIDNPAGKPRLSRRGNHWVNPTNTESVDHGKENRISSHPLGKPPFFPHESAGPLTTLMKRKPQCQLPPTPDDADRSPSPRKPESSLFHSFTSDRSQRKVCKQFLLRGSCSYGSRCLYYHEEQKDESCPSQTVSSSTPSHKSASGNTTTCGGITTTSATLSQEPSAALTRQEDRGVEVEPSFFICDISAVDNSTSTPNSRDITVSPINASQQTDRSRLSLIFSHKEEIGKDSALKSPPPKASTAGEREEDATWDDTAGARKALPNDTANSLCINFDLPDAWQNGHDALSPPLLSCDGQQPSVRLVDLTTAPVSATLPTCSWPVSFSPTAQNLHTNAFSAFKIPETTEANSTESRKENETIATEQLPETAGAIPMTLCPVVSPYLGFGSGYGMVSFPSVLPGASIAFWAFPYVPLSSPVGMVPPGVYPPMGVYPCPIGYYPVVPDSTS